jgi:hypothetical protein
MPITEYYLAERPGRLCPERVARPTEVIRAGL